MKKIAVLEVAIFAGIAFIGCEKEQATFVENEMGRKMVTLTCGNNDTRATMIAGNSFVWTNGDKVDYYTYNMSKGTRYSDVSVDQPVTKSGASTEVEISYRKKTSSEDFDDDNVVVVYKGNKIRTSAITGNTNTALTLAGAIPASQTGALEDYMVSIGTALITAPDIQLKQQQTFISFSVLENSVVSGNFGRIEITAKAGTTPAAADIAGDAQYIFSGTASTALGTEKSQKITISTIKEIGTTYYVAMMPGSYTGDGITISFYKNATATSGEEPLKYVNTGAITLQRGKINVLDVLDAHAVIPATSIGILPEYSAIAYVNDLKMTKKIWIPFTPHDVSSIKWEVEPPEMGSVTNLPDENKTIGGVSKECKVGLFTPAKSSGTATITATLAGGLTASCTVEVGDFIYLGSDFNSKRILWARSNLTGGQVNGTGDAEPMKLCDNSYEAGGFYMWGEHTTPLRRWDWNWDYNTDCPKWNGSTGYDDGRAGMDRGGKYNSTYHGSDYGPNILDADDDIATLTRSDLRMPQNEELLTVFSGAEHETKVKEDGGVMEVVYGSDLLGYGDVYINMPYGGMLDKGGQCYKGYAMVMWVSSTVANVNVTDYGSTSYPYDYVYAYFYGSYTAAVRSRYGAAWNIRPIKNY